MDDEPFVNAETAESMGVSREAYDQVTEVVGHLPNMAELSTLLAMWQSNGCQQSLYGWLKGQRHIAKRDAYIYTGEDDTYNSINEPHAKECVKSYFTAGQDIKSYLSGSCIE